VKNHSPEQLGRLVPGHQVVQEDDVQRTVITRKGFTEEDDVIFVSSNNKENPFANSLVLDDLSPLAMASARNILKSQTNEVLKCLEILKSQESIEKATTALNNLANELRLDLGSTGRKRNLENCLAVNMNVD
jgi:hypothetical protein